jgi:head-tail adaptor
MMGEELSGALTERVGIERFVDLRDAAGATIGHWAPVGSAWAAIAADGSGGGDGEAQRTRRRWRVTLRAPAAVGLTSRLVWRGQWLAVLSVADDPRQPDRIELRCEARP